MMDHVNCELVEQKETDEVGSFKGVPRLEMRSELYDFKNGKFLHD